MPDADTPRASHHARVLLAASDRRYRAVTATLLSQRGCEVAAGSEREDLCDIAMRERADVVVIDASGSLTAAACQAARLGSLRPRVGVVAVSADPCSHLAALPVLPKWGHFDELFEAIARAGGSRNGETHVTH